MKKKILILLIIIIIISTVILTIIINNNNYNKNLEGRWSSIDGSLIKVIKGYNNDNPVYENDNIINYWLDIKKNGKYLVYYNDIADKSRSNYNIEKNLIEKGTYNIDTNNESIIYFSPNNHSDKFIWTCEIDNNKLYNCNNYAYEFLKQASE